MPAMYPHQRCCDLASAEVARFAAVIRGADPATPVPTCGRWTMADLIQHIGHIHRWAAGMVAELSRTRHSRRKADLPLPADPATWPDWLADAQRLLVPVLRAADPEARMWAWGPDKHVRFWSRRMVHETAVHRVDAELALGIRPQVDPAVAADGVEEVLENLPRSRVLRGQGERLRLVAGDRPDRWTITRQPTGFQWARGDPDGDQPGPAVASVTVRAGTPELYLLLWGRRPWTDARYEVTGDHALLAHWQRHAVIT
jgi:uncharacterized protein (TIGR03083 family)